MNFQDALAETLRNVYCTSMQLADNFWSRVGVPGTPIRAPFRPRATLGYRLFCNREPPPLPDSGFIGGRCPVPYEITVVERRDGVPGTSAEGQFVVWTNASPFVVQGPLTPTGGSIPVGAVVGGHSAGYFGVINGAGNQLNFSLTTKQAGAANTNITNWTVTSRNVTATRQDGLPDDCGDSIIPIPPVPNPNPTIPDDVEYEDDDGNPVTIPVNIVFGFPFIFINGTLNVPFRVQINPEINFNIDGTINLETGDVNFNFGGTPGGDGCLPKPPDDFTPIGDEPPDPDPGIPQPDPVDDDPTDDRLKDIIRGVIVTASVDNPDATIINQIENPDLYIPRIGNVQFAIQIRNSVSWTERVNVTNLRQFIPCPWEGGAIDVRGTPEPGVIMTLTPVIGQVSDRVRYEV